MMINPVLNRAAYAAPVAQALTQVVDEEIVSIQAERVLDAVRPILMEARDVDQRGPAQNIPNGIGPNIPPELLEQLRQIEANNARQIQAEAQGMDGLRALQERVRQREVAWRENIDRVAQQRPEVVKCVRDEVETIRLSALGQIAVMERITNQLGQEAEDLRAEAAHLQQHISLETNRTPL